MGYELTATDLQEMLHGEKITSSEKTLTWKKDGKETVIRGRLVLNEEYKVRIAPKLRSKQTTDHTCPKCNSGKLQLITALDGSKWYGCNAFPHCRFTKAFIPHTFKSALLEDRSNRTQDGETGSETNCDVTSVQSQSDTIQIKNIQTTKKQSAELKKPERPARGRLDSATPPAAPIGATLKGRQNPSVHAGKADGQNPYQRIPKFILRMLKLDEPQVRQTKVPSRPK